MELFEIKTQIDNSSVQIQEMVDSIVSDCCKELDDYMQVVRSCFLADKILDGDLDKILVRIPVFLYSINAYLSRIDVTKGLAAEQAKYNENNILLSSTGTVAEKMAKASNGAINDRTVQLAYKIASNLIQSKVNGAMEILASAKKVQQRRLEEMKLTKMAGNAASF